MMGPGSFFGPGMMGGSGAFSMPACHDLHHPGRARAAPIERRRQDPRRTPSRGHRRTTREHRGRSPPNSSPASVEIRESAGWPSASSSSESSRSAATSPSATSSAGATSSSGAISVQSSMAGFGPAIRRRPGRDPRPMDQRRRGAPPGRRPHDDQRGPRSLRGTPRPGRPRVRRLVEFTAPMKAGGIRSGDMLRRTPARPCTARSSSRRELAPHPPRRATTRSRNVTGRRRSSCCVAIILGRRALQSRSRRPSASARCSAYAVAIPFDTAAFGIARRSDRPRWCRRRVQPVCVCAAR